MMFRSLISMFLVACVATAVPASERLSQDLNCLEHDSQLVSCLLVKTVGALNRAAKSNDIEIVEGVTFVRDAPMERTAKSMSEQMSEMEMMNELPRDITGRMVKLMNMLYDSALSFMKSHSLKLNMSENTVSRALVEGRGKIKKVVLPLIAAAGVKIFALVPVLLGGLALLVLKSLFIGKIALLVAGIMAFQKMFGGGSGVGSFFAKNPQLNSWYDSGTAGGWHAGSAGSQGYYSRSLDEAKEDAQNLAYSAHAPAGETD